MALQVVSGITGPTDGPSRNVLGMGGRSVRIVIGIAALAGLVVVGVGCGGDAQTVTVTQAPKDASAAIASTIAKVRSGVVRIDVTTCDGEGNGSGFVIAPNLIATAAHVVRDVTDISVTPEGGSTTSATVVGSDPSADLALILADSPLGAKRLRFHSGPDPAVGTDVVALGYPLGLPFTATRGAISGLGRDLTIESTDYTGLFQTDAAVNPGNSGGAIINVQGEVVGVVVAAGTDSQGIGFGIPTSSAKGTLNDWVKSPSPQSLATCDSTSSAATVDTTQVETTVQDTPVDQYPPGEIGGTGFQSPSGNISCDVQTDGLLCTTSNDGYAVLLPDYGAPNADYTGQQAYGGDRVPYGYTWTSDSGNFSCDSATDGITCTNQSGDGFFLNRDDYRVITP